MTDEEVKNLPLGLYVIYWSSDPDNLSVAAVGVDAGGRRWFAPTNWVSIPWYDWSTVFGVRLITTQKLERETDESGDADHKAGR